MTDKKFAFRVDLFNIGQARQRIVSRNHNAMNHCVSKIVEIVARGEDDHRSILQLGYNLGRLSELTGLGRETFWDRWKDPVANWDLATLEILAHELLTCNFIPTTTID